MGDQRLDHQRRHVDRIYDYCRHQLGGAHQYDLIVHLWEEDQILDFQEGSSRPVWFAMN